MRTYECKRTYAYSIRRYTYSRHYIHGALHAKERMTLFTNSRQPWHSSRTLGSHDTLHELSHSRHCILSALHAKKRIKALHAHINALQTNKRTRSYSESRSESVCASLQTYTCVCVCVCVCVCTRTHKCTHTQNTPWGLYTTRMCCMLVGLFCKC